MQLTLKPSDKNTWPLRGALIRGASPHIWLQTLKEASIPLAQVEVYALPGLAPNSLWGCMVLPISPDYHLPKHGLAMVQRVSAKLYLSAHSTLYPPCTAEELQSMFASPVFMHPELGTVPLSEALQWADILGLPQAQTSPWQKPARSIILPQKLRSIRLEQSDPDEVLERMEKESFPQQEPQQEKPLGTLEKIRLKLYQALKPKEGKTGGRQNAKPIPPARIEPKKPKVSKLRQWFSKITKRLNERVQQDMDELMRRNQKEADRLMDMFRKDIHEALKWAIPLGNDVDAAGGTPGQVKLERHNQILRGGSRGGGSAVLPDDSLMQLRKQYQEAAAQLEKDGEHTQAAFVYMKLLKQHQLAAEVLKRGKKYPEAAGVYLKYLNNKKEAAACYEAGHMPLEAIKLYQELKEHEKAGDLYMNMGERDLALEEYEQKVHAHKSYGHHKKAGDLIREKMEDLPRALHTYLEGYEANRKNPHCLGAYLKYQEDEAQVSKDLDRYNAQMESPEQVNQWLNLLWEEYQRQRSTQHQAKDLVYQQLAQHIHKQPELAQFLRYFHPKDVELKKDTIRFGSKKKRLGISNLMSALNQKKS